MDRSEDESDDASEDEEEYFSYYFKQFVNENPQLPPTYLDVLTIAANSIVVLYDDRTNRIVSFDVECPDNKRFMASSKLSGKLSFS